MLGIFLLVFDIHLDFKIFCYCLYLQKILFVKSAVKILELKWERTEIKREFICAVWKVAIMTDPTMVDHMTRLKLKLLEKVRGCVCNVHIFVSSKTLEYTANHSTSTWVQEMFYIHSGFFFYLKEQSAALEYYNCGHFHRTKVYQIIWTLKQNKGKSTYNQGQSNYNPREIMTR